MSFRSIQFAQSGLSAIFCTIITGLTLTAFGPANSASLSESDWVRPLNELRAYRDRPLFSSSRKPPFVPPVNSETPLSDVNEQTFNGVLVGIIFSEIGGIVLIKDADSEKVSRVYLNSNYKNWTLISINRHDVTFIFRDAIKTLSLDDILRHNMAAPISRELPTSME